MQKLRIRTLVRQHGTHYVALATDVLARLGLKRGDQVVVTEDGSSIRIRKLTQLEISDLYEGASIASAPELQDARPKKGGDTLSVPGVTVTGPRPRSE